MHILNSLTMGTAGAKGATYHWYPCMINTAIAEVSCSYDTTTNSRAVMARVVMQDPLTKSGSHEISTRAIL